MFGMRRRDFITLLGGGAAGNVGHQLGVECADLAGGT